MQKELFAFFEKNIQQDRPVLLALSGGPDSTCLLHMLLAWNKAQLHIVHVDHGWRKESILEREALEHKARSMKLPFYYTTLNPSTYTKNKEAQSREERYNFFKKVAKECGAQGVLLGHHQGDLSETVLKRVLEGASLPNLAGLHKKREVDGLVLFRPLLMQRKAEIISWLTEKGIDYFTDETNLDTRYLRGKMRTDIFPFIKERFGKEFEASLAHIGAEAEALKGYLDRVCKPYLDQVVLGPWGKYYKALPNEAVELCHLLRIEEVLESRQQVAQAVQFIIERVANKQFTSKKGILHIDRGYAFFEQQPMTEVHGSIPLKEGSYSFSGWDITVSKVQQKGSVHNHFEDAWKGSLTTYLPEGSYLLQRASPQMVKPSKVPNFLRAKVPIITVNDRVVEDFLTGKPSLNGLAQSLFVRIAKR